MNDTSENTTDTALEHSRGEVTIKSENGYFFVKPHFQVGSGETHLRSLTVAFHIFPDQAKWRTDYKRSDKKKWHEAKAVKSQFRVDNVLDNVRYLATLEELSAGCVYQYRISRNDEVVFSGSVTAPKKAAQSSRFAIFGDVADGSAASKRIAYAVHEAAPDLVMLAGDLVYEDGRVSEYVSNFFPVYNSDDATPETGAPLLRSIVTVAALGNHDARWPQDSRLLPQGKVPDALGYFHFWNQTDNGPQLSKEQLSTFTAGKKKRKRLAWLLGKKFLRRSNFSFDYGNVHWLVLDGNKHADWSSPFLRAWVEADLQASNATWKFVCIHQPPFTHDPKYADEQSTRHLCDIFQSSGVDIVFSGHSHAYERHHPLRFFRQTNLEGDDDPDKVDGDFELDLSFDGLTNTRSSGVLYIVSGAGEPSEQPKGTAPKFLAKRVEGKRSFTLCDVAGATVCIKQIDQDGAELDRLTLRK
ncbi:MAG: metallophosphoesterase [Candidatus Melainabacteria bacterium]|nr:metallophosphoesterase [Candidatus Melainabacteria bacterium]